MRRLCNGKMGKAKTFILRHTLGQLGVMAFMVHEVKMGKRRTRMSFSRIDEVLEMPDLIEVQKNSYERFLKEDLREVLNDVSPITDYSENLVLEFVDYSLDDTPKNS